MVLMVFDCVSFGLVLVLWLETAVDGIGPFNLKWKGFDDKGVP